MPPTILLTRPEAASRRFAARLAPLGLPVVISPILRILPLPHDRAAVDQAQGLVFTSAHGVAEAGLARGRPAICVGPATARAARQAGYAVTEGPGDALGMLPLLQDLGPGWLHVHGAHVARDLPLPGVAVYDQQAQPLSAAARTLLDAGGPVILPLFSPRSSRLVAEAAGQARAPLWLAPISPAAAEAWTGPVARQVLAQSPDALGVARAIESLLAPEQTR